MGYDWHPHSNFGAADTDADYAHEAYEDDNGRKWDTVAGHPIPLGHDREQTGSPMAGRIEQAEDVEKFLLAGKATFTLVSTKTGDRYTYKVSKPQDFNEDRPIWFVSALTGADNENDFSYIGNIKPESRVGHASYAYQHGKKARLAEHATSVRGVIYFLRWLFERDAVPEGIEVWHEGRCGRCNRKLTVPESIESGFGPECINYV